jgi:hypothetical protein
VLAHFVAAGEKKVTEKNAKWAEPSQRSVRADWYRSCNEPELGFLGAPIHHPGRRGPAAAHPGVVYGPAQFPFFLFSLFFCFLFCRFLFLFFFYNLSIIKSK